MTMVEGWYHELDRLGKEGWEAYAVSRGIMYLKRPMEPVFVPIIRGETEELVGGAGVPR